MEPGVAILAVAFDGEGTRYSGYGASPQFTDYVESAEPPETCTQHEQGWYKIDTSKGPVTVTAAAQVSLPTGEVREFSYWKMQPDPFQPSVAIFSRTLEIEQGEWGWVVAWYGVVRPKLVWREYRQIDDFVAMMMRHVPHWEPPIPYHVRQSKLRD